MRYIDSHDDNYCQTFIITRHNCEDDVFFSVDVSYDTITDSDFEHVLTLSTRRVYSDLILTYVEILKMVDSPFTLVNWSSSCLLMDCETAEEVWFELNDASTTSMEKLEKDFEEQVNAAKAKLENSAKSPQ